MPAKSPMMLMMPMMMFPLDKSMVPFCWCKLAQTASVTNCPSGWAKKQVGVNLPRS